MSSETEVIITQSPAVFICLSEMRTSQSVEHFNRIAPDKLVTQNFTWQAGTCFQYSFSELHEKLYSAVHCERINCKWHKNKTKWFFLHFITQIIFLWLWLPDPMIRQLNSSFNRLTPITDWNNKVTQIDVLFEHAVR